MLQVSQYPSRLTEFAWLIAGKTTSHSQYAFSIQTTRGVNGYRDPYGIRTVVGKQYRYIRNLFPENEFSIPVSRQVFEAILNWMSNHVIVLNDTCKGQQRNCMM